MKNKYVLTRGYYAYRDLALQPCIRDTRIFAKIRIFRNGHISYFRI